MSHNPAKNHLAFCHHSCNFSLAWVPRFWAPWDTFSWKFATFWAQFSDNTAQATLFTPPWTTLPAHVTIFHAASTVPCTTVSHACTVFETAVHVTSAVVETVHCTTALVQSTNHEPLLAFDTVSEIHSLKSCQTHLIHCTVVCPASFTVSTAHWNAAFVESANCFPESFICSTHSFPASFTFSTHELTLSFTAAAIHCFSSVAGCSVAGASAGCSVAGASAGCSVTGASAGCSATGAAGWASVGVSVDKSTALKSGAGVWTVCSSITGAVFWVPAVCTFCSSCVCVIIYTFNK